ncbi:HD domain-containing protein [Parasulfuritortus cantonensis]|uniref:HD domain-containing protein n=1 Tax=Parasulfuritortus cantonensis TaxID=2528202 RepID=A0A4R1BD94_9PROT|nr:HD domain-containing phosphohydrolase [Parasulfuritortus cantonensis]TCJ14987.1 HD domain-containing protein [Parasulfuritortus cantonensis]
MPRSRADFELLFQFSKALSVALGFRDIYTKLHSERVRDLACLLGEACGLDEHGLEELRIAAAFHDIGKIGIPDRLLAKVERLEHEERAEIERHPLIGEEILSAVGLPGAAEAARIIRHHHERYDGSGYPDGLSGDAIPVAARIISVVDSYDAMAERRSYHAPRGHRQIVAVLYEERGGKHDPEILDTFLRIIETSLLRAPDA